MQKLLLLTLLFISIFAQNILIPASRPYSKLNTLHFHTIKDFYTIPQDPAYYALQIPKIPYSKQLKVAKEYREHFFAPWSMQSFSEPQRDIIWATKMFNYPVYRSAKTLFSRSLVDKIVQNANFQALDGAKLYAITLCHSNLRALPTGIPAYRDPWKSTQGFPFDYLQNSAIEINTPLYISHYSLDKRWAFVHAPGSFGWIKTKNIALVDKSFMQAFKEAKLGVLIRDNSLLISNGKKVSYIKIGALFANIKGHYTFAAKDAKGYAHFAAINRVSNSIITPFPLAFVPQNVALIARQLRGEPYGWGGVCYGRDCSATTQDFFAVFGQFLHRSSGNQLRDATSVVNIKPYKGHAKKDMILKNAKPFCSLLYVPGHIGIYLGRYGNEPIIMHTYWGVRLKDYSKYTLSKTIITTLEPGKELKSLRRKSTMSNTLQKILNLELCQ